MGRRSRLRRGGRAITAIPGGFLHLTLLASLRRRPSLQAHAQLLLLGLPVPAPTASRLLRPHLRSGNPSASLRLFLRVLRDRRPSPPDSPEAVPDSFSLSAALAACSRHASPSPGFSIHGFILKSGFASDVFAANSLLNFYGSFGLHSLARNLFDEMPVRDTVSFNTLISSYVPSCCINDAFEVFRIMKERGFMPDGWTVMALLSACAESRELRTAKAVHGVARRMLHTQLFDSGEVVNGLVDVYVKCRAMALARKVFDLAGEKARDARLWTTMVSGYAKVQEFDIAQVLFREMPEKDTIAWTALISGFVRAGRYKEAVVLFEEMDEAGFEADEATVVTVLSACVGYGNIDLAKRLHHRVGRGLISRNAKLATTFVDMYAKHGCIQTAQDVFSSVDDDLKTLELFNAMINGLARCKFGEKSIALFHQMESLGIHPDKITFIGILSACRHNGFVSQGLRIFDSMVEKYGVKQEIEHYACMVDLLARDGQLDDAYLFIQKMPFKANSVVWSSLLRACMVHDNIRIRKIAEEQLLQLDPNYKPGNLPLSNLFSVGKRKERAARLRKFMNHKPVSRRTK
ncbi:pentatricopeptide repeat-containing protein At1g31430 [Oryza brachyantha]|uniref:pentatricopeptide repeat-containing protein At1g31430 n=1 Tax=Oryza brachyantha TaxID=4533 RepID=UPI0003EA8A06|nr:pentatricopeptide repeat-containing protein At1g31430 [Oryza brachyantha]